MIIELPDKELEKLHLSPAQARVEVAVGLYAGRQVPLDQAARIAGMAKVLFLEEIGKRGIGIHYFMEDLQHDIGMAEKLNNAAA